VCAIRSNAPLDGIRVLDMSRVVAGPTAAKLLAQLGADVVMIDTDPATRSSALVEPVFHESLNRGKRTAVVNLGTGAGRDTFDRLLAEADVIVQNASMDAIDRLDIAPETLCVARPDATVVSLNTFGRSGPWARGRGYAEIANVVTGVAARSAPDPIVSGSSPLVDRPRWPFTDYAAGVLGAFGAIASIYHAQRGGPAHVVEVALVRAAALEQVTYAYDHDGKTWDEPMGADAVGWGTWQRVYETSDDWIFVGVPDAARERVLTQFAVTDEQALADAFRVLKANVVVSRLTELGAGAHRVCSIEQLLAPDGVWDRRGLRLEDTTARHGVVTMLGPVARLHRTPLLPGDLPLPFGAATAAIEEEAGWPPPDPRQ
jgi:crotonobetainyl-CoA:carnitine CoA-transferase CaiB-like acyl-CoA transferase